MNPIPKEQLEELANLANAAQVQAPAYGNYYNARLKGNIIRAREKYRRLSFELAGRLAEEVLALREQIKAQFPE